MPLYAQNGNLLNKTGTLGTSVGCCCDPPVPPPPLCCCDEEGFRVLTGNDECANEPFLVPDPRCDARTARRAGHLL